MSNMPEGTKKWEDVCHGGSFSKPVPHQAAVFLSDLAIALDSIGMTGDASDCREWAKRLWGVAGEAVARAQ